VFIEIAMINQYVLLVPKNGMSDEDFLAYLDGTHKSLVLTMPGIVEYKTKKIQTSYPDKSYKARATLSFNTEEDRIKAFSDMGKNLREDAANFCDTSKTFSYTVEEQ
jgi:uncharacterized protein (TIGR02118 family)